MSNRTLLAIGLAIVMLAPPAATFGGEIRSCVVDGVEGTRARYWHSGVWSDVVVKLALPAEAKVTTGFETRVRIVCDDGAIVSIGSGTEVNLENLVGAADSQRSVAIQLIEGIIGLVVPQRNWRRFEVRTPVAIASVRSTEWLIEWRRGGSAAIFVRMGEVAVRSARSERFILGMGEGITISAAGAAGDVKQWGAARIAESTAMLGFDWR
jgi:ferric-dicitrate binding protein FerR (iron transport regulator)